MSIWRREATPVDGDPEEITLIPAAKPGRCPVCHVPIPWHLWSSDRFYCPNCDALLRLRRSYFVALYGVTILLVYLGVYALGFRGMSSWSLVAIALLPAYWLVVFINLRIVPVDIEATFDFGAELHGRRAAVGISIVDVEEDDRDWAPAEAPVAVDREPRLVVIKQPVSITGALVAALLIAFTGYHIWRATTVVINRARPDLLDSKRGPGTFDLRAELDADGIAFTNATHESWVCRVRLGFSVAASSSEFPLGPGDSRVLAYAEFRPQGPGVMEPFELREQARDYMQAQCRTKDGRTRGGPLD
jgi:hypothetical protein